ncbi:MAG TPA: hypothetical protein VHM31_21130 [Polyangia bacterium]|nr:hypothetical protein [Polyangia bacterium]
MRAPSVAVAAGALASLAAGCSNTRPPAEWAYISPAIFQPTCATQSCHSRAAAVAGLDFSDPDRGYESLTALWVWVPNPTAMDLSTLSCGKAGGQPVCEQRLRPLVTAYDPNASRLVNMLRARGASRMPPDRPLPEGDIQIVEQWILNGATRYPGGPPAGAGSPDGGSRDGGAHDAAARDGAAHDGAIRDGRASDGGGGGGGGGGSGGGSGDGSVRPVDGASRS